MSNEREPEPPVGSGSTTGAQRQQVLELLRRSEAPLTDEEVAQLLGIKYAGRGGRVSRVV